MTTLDAIRGRRKDIREIAGKHGATNVRIFGSVLRGDDGPASDIDLLVDTAGVTSAWFPAGLILDLEELLARKIDVVTERGLNPFIRERVLREARPV